MKFIYETPDIELNKFKFADVLAAGDDNVFSDTSSDISFSSEFIPEQDTTDNPFGDGN